MCQRCADNSPWKGLSNGVIPDHTSLTIKTGCPPFNLQRNGWKLTNMSTEYIWEHTGWPLRHAMNNRRAFARAPIEWTQNIEHNVVIRWLAVWWWPCINTTVMTTIHWSGPLQFITTVHHCWPPNACVCSMRWVFDETPQWSSAAVLQSQSHRDNHRPMLINRNASFR